MNEDRRKGDRRVSPAIGDFALEERASLLTQIVFLKSVEKERNALREELAALKAQQSAGVALPERHELRADNDIEDAYQRGWNASLDEVARLNPCRAQAVADACEFLVIKNLAARYAATLWDFHHACPECGNVGSHLLGCQEIYARNFSGPSGYMMAFDAMVSAAPSAKKESE